MDVRQKFAGIKREFPYARMEHRHALRNLEGRPFHKLAVKFEKAATPLDKACVAVAMFDKARTDAQVRRFVRLVAGTKCAQRIAGVIELINSYNPASQSFANSVQSALLTKSELAQPRPVVFKTSARDFDGSPGDFAKVAYMRGLDRAADERQRVDAQSEDPSFFDRIPGESGVTEEGEEPVHVVAGQQ